MHIGRTRWEREGRELGSDSIREGTSKTASKAPKLGEMPGSDFPSRPSEGINPADNLILDSWPLEL